MARTAAQNKRIRDAKRELILLEALSQFSKKGYYSTRISDIAEAADISQGLLYYYYPSKEAVYIDLVDDALERINDTARFVRDMNKTNGEKVMYALKILFKTIETSPRFRQTCRMIAQATYQADISEEAQAQLDKKRDVAYRIMAEIFRRGQLDGNVVDGDPMQLSILFWTSVNGLSIYYATRDIAANLPDYKLVAPMFLKQITEIPDIEQYIAAYRAGRETASFYHYYRPNMSQTQYPGRPWASRMLCLLSVSGIIRCKY